MHCLLVCQNSTVQAPAGAVRILFDAWNTESAQDISLPVRMASSMLALRTEHAAWVYELGALKVPGGTLAQSLAADGELSMWWTSTLYERHPKVTPALYNVYRLRCLEQLLEELGAASLEAHGLEEGLAAVVGALCRAHGWTFASTNEVKAKKKSLVRTIYDKTPAILQAVVRFADWLARVRSKLKTVHELPASSKETGTIVTYFPNIAVDEAQCGRLVSRYWESLHAALEGEAEPGTAPAVRWLFIRFPSPQGSLAQCAAWAEGFQKSQHSGVSFNYLEEFLTPKDMLKAIKRWCSLVRTSFRIEPAVRQAFHYSGSKLDLWPLLGEEYAASFRGWRCLERCLQNQGIKNYVAAAGKQRWYTFPMENCPWERMVTYAVRTRNAGPVFGAQHSTIRPTDFRYFDDPRTWTDPATRDFQPDLVAGNGESACAQWREAGVPEERLTKIEALRYLYLAKTRAKTTFSKNLLIVTSFFADETTAHLELLAECLKKGILNPSLVTVKPHPYLPVTDTLARLLGADEAAKLRISTATMAEELDKAPVVWASNSTTAVLEAAIMGLPVMVMPPYGDFDLCPIQDIAGLVRTFDAESVRRALENPLSLTIPDGYLCLDAALPRWRRLLGLEAGKAD